ncbi:hypothetical protein V6N13_070388 [Hibiscus sabdariffa]
MQFSCKKDVTGKHWPVQSTYSHSKSVAYNGHRAAAGCRRAPRLRRRGQHGENVARPCCLAPAYDRLGAV